MVITKVLVSAAAAVAVAVAASAGADPSPFNALSCSCPKAVKRGERPVADQVALGIQSGLTALQGVPGPH